MEGYVIRRQYLDDLLFDEASHAATRIVQGFQVRDLIRDGDRVCGVLREEFRTSKRLQNLGRLRPLLNFVIHKAARNAQISGMICGVIAQAIPMKHTASPVFYLRLLFMR